MVTREARSNESGFTLIELIVAGAIAMFVVAGIIATMTMSQRNYFVQDRVAETQQGSRIALDLVARDARMAGHGFPRGTTDKLFWYPVAGIISMAAITGGSLPSGLPATLSANNAPGCSPPCTGQLAWTDAVAIKSLPIDSGSTAPIRVIKHPAPPAVSMQLEKSGSPPAGGDILLCETPDGQFQTICVTTVNTASPNFDLITGNAGGASTCPQGFNSPGGPGADYTNGQCRKIQQGKTTTSVYYVNPVVVPAGAPPVGRLMFWNGDSSTPPVVVANDVEDFQVAYFAASTWKSPPVSADDANIQLVRISTVTRTAADDPKFSSSPASVSTLGTLEDHGPLSTALDGFRRRLLSTTMKVRNNTPN